MRINDRWIYLIQKRDFNEQKTKSRASDADGDDAIGDDAIGDDDAVGSLRELVGFTASAFIAMERAEESAGEADSER